MSLYDPLVIAADPPVPDYGSSPQDPILKPAISDAETLSLSIFEIVMRARRAPETDHSRAAGTCVECQGPHLHKIKSAIAENRAILFALPAFPGKSPNRQKVLGTLPDKAEELALRFLNGLCERIQKIYPPGAQIKLCSDGRVFSDIVGIKESDISEYQSEIKRIISDLNLSHLTTFALDDVDDAADFNGMRARLMSRYGESREFLRERILAGRSLDAGIEDQQAHRMYQGMIRFLNDDIDQSTTTLSRAQIHKDSKRRAMDLILRSNAWSRLIAEEFPEAVRLSIHPQGCGSSKIGIRLINDEVWITPWHGVAVETVTGHVLMKRWEAEQSGARLIVNALGQPSHYRLQADLADTVPGVMTCQ